MRWRGRSRGSSGEPPAAAGERSSQAAAGVGVSRVAAAKHFPSDVLAGAVLGTASGLVVYKLKF